LKQIKRRYYYERCNRNEQWLNKPCPKCGENLLTEEDYRNALFLIKMVETANKIYPKRKDNEEVSTMTVAMNGSGNMKIDIKE
jgi:hypothetical protein